MKFSIAIGITIAALTTTVTAGSNTITYKVISLVPNNQTLGVIVDNQIYSLNNVDKSTSLLHYGEAPAATSGYKYVILQKDNSSQIIESENFTRNNLQEDTLNEYYGRSWNTYSNLTELPTILPPLPIIDRIKSDLHIENQIPTIHFMGNQSAIDYMHNNQMKDIDLDLKMTYISPNDVKTFDSITISVSGMSTRRMPKLSYKLKLPKNQDLHGYRRLKLRSMSVDISFMRENLGYNMARSVGLPTSGHSYVRVYINDQAVGLFGFVEHMKSTWVRNEFGNGDKKFKQGALYLADINAGKNNTSASSDDTVKNQQTAKLSARDFPDFGNIPSFGGNQTGISNQNSISDLSFLGNNVSLYSEGQYSVKEDPSVGTANFTRIMDLSKFLSEQPTTPVNDSVIPLWEEKMDVDSFLRGLAFEVAISNADGYLGLSNNYMLYDDISNERLLFSEQDLDLVMGTSFFSNDLIHAGNYSKFPGILDRPVPSRMLQVPRFKQNFENLLYNISKELVHPSVMGPRIDQMYAMLSEDVAWDSHLPKLGKPLLFESLGMNITTSDYMDMFSKIPYKSMVYGPSFSNLSMALMDWVNLKSSNVMTFFNEHLQNNSTNVGA